MNAFLALALGTSACLLAAGCATGNTCKVEDAGTVTARYAARMRVECTGYTFDACPAREAIEAQRKAELEAACSTR